MYEESRSAAVPAVVWRSIDRPEGPVDPDGCMDLIWFGDHLLVAGPDTRSHVSTAPPGQQVVGLRFAPGIGPLVLGVPAVEVRDSLVRLDAIWDERHVRHLTERVAEHPDRAFALERVAAARLAGAEPIPRDLPALVTMIGRGARVSTVAGRLGISERQLHRRSLTSFGYGPKVLARILRFTRASHLLRSGVSKAEAAALTGYADQPHMSREFKTLTGQPAG